jgi:hypothetical protein
MSETRPARIPSLVKKYLMAGSGLVLVLFVLGHMAGNLQIFSGSPATINRYARFLHSIPELLWLVRSFLFSCVIVHIWMAVLLTLENRAARPAQYAQAANIQTSFAARTMIWSGVIILAFILFHLAQFTLEIVNPMYAWLEYPLLHPRRLAAVHAPFARLQQHVPKSGGAERKMAPPARPGRVSRRLGSLCRLRRRAGFGAVFEILRHPNPPGAIHPPAGGQPEMGSCQPAPDWD